MKRIPLADDEIAIVEDADIVPMIENAFGLHERLELAVFIHGCGTAGGADHFAGGIQDDGEAAGVLRQLVDLRRLRPADAGVELLACNDRAADHGTWDGEGFEVFAFEGETAEAVIDAGGDDDGGFVRTLAGIDGDAVGVVEAFFGGDAVLAAETLDEFAACVIT